MKTRIILPLLFLLPLFLSAQTAYKWKLHVGAGSLMYLGDLNMKQGRPTGKQTPSLHLALERRFTYGIAARAGINYGRIAGDDRVNGRNQLKPDNPNFSRALNFRTRVMNSYLQLVYNTNNGYLLKESARVSPFVMVGLGITGFRVFTDQYYGPSSGFMYDYANVNNEIRPDITFGDKTKGDGNFETDITEMNLDGTKHANVVMTVPVGMGMNLRFTDKWSAQIAATMLYTFTDNLDGVTGQFRTDATPGSQEAYLTNPGGLNPQVVAYRGNPNGKRDKMVSPTVGITYSFGGNYYERGDVVDGDTTLKPSTKTSIATKEKMEIDPFDESNIRPTDKNYVLREREDIVLFTNSKGRQDTMRVMRMDTIPASMAYNYENNSIFRGGDKAPSYSSAASPTNNTGASPALNQDVLNDIYAQLKKLSESIERTEKRMDKIENTIANSALTAASSANVSAASAATSASMEVLNNSQTVLIYFPYGKSSIDNEGYKQLGTIAEILKKYPDIGVALNAFADPSGSTGLNMGLSQARANSVRKYLTGVGVKSYQILAQYHGADDNQQLTDPQKRRVEVEFIKVR